MPGSGVRAAASCVFAALTVLVLCEYVVYYVSISRCSWPRLEDAGGEEEEEALRVLFLSDPHLLGAIRGHWLDKLRREWQMERAFQTSLHLLNPEVVFILGDVFDEGKWSSEENWNDDVRRFKRIFRHPHDTELVVLAGNHDIGFHYEMTRQKLERFERVFNETSARVLTFKGVNFVLVNSVALHGDGCSVCRHVEQELQRLSRQLNCSIQGSQCDGRSKSQGVAPIRPVLLQHYPLYRPSDAACTGKDAAPAHTRHQPFHQRYDVLSQDASKKLLWWFKPRLILSGHTHSACEVWHQDIYREISVPSFSWRNRDDPSVILGTFSRRNFRLVKCFLPEESSVMGVYCVCALIGALMALAHFRRIRSSRKHKGV